MAFSHSSISHHLRVDGVSLSYPHRRVLTDVSFSVAAGERAGLIGENGSGKSTLLRIIAGVLPADAGAITFVSDSAEPVIGLLHQEPPFASTETVREALERSVARQRLALSELDAAAEFLATHPGDAAELRYSHALDQAENLQAWDIEAQISTMLAGLGLGSVAPDRPAGELSGGQRARLSLAWVLLSKPDVLLLDEPTNHLDDDATEHVRRVMTAWRGPVLMASHDRVFLDDVATMLLDLDPAPEMHRDGAPADETASGRGVRRFGGTYSDYVAAKDAQTRRWEQQFREEQAELKRLRSAVKDNQQVGHASWTPRTETRMARKFYADRNARVVARRVGDARSRLGELEQAQVRKPPAPLTFSGLPSGAHRESAGTIVTVAGAAVEGRLRPVSFVLSAGEKLLITGANGSGKSTLVGLIAGLLNPTSGIIQVASTVRVGMLGQHVGFRAAQREMTAAAVYLAEVGPEVEQEMPLRGFGLLRPADENKPVGSLSTGQQRRLELAMVLARPPALLILDEPTNHLALQLTSELEEAIQHYGGAVIVASHDRWLRRNWVGRRLELSGRPELSM